MKRASIAVAAAALLLAPATAGAGSSRPVKRTIKVLDYYYTPTKITVARGSTVVWKWPTGGGDSHDVKLAKGPKGVKKFHSAIASSEFSYRRKLTVPGLYSIVCTLHPEMKMKIRVRR